ncbi:hypothetical protein B5C34_12525 [Pacificimonas flava]|uniref:Uncharacterized protein n=2 Tax=Pacificimonas TaxID=1960290 RepID=A0A219B8S2_9SPHN|nr:MULTISPECIES: hypothetical protein [Pacificimonas]MBZ6378509.1 hypothetical protein [Pacificimonas aurantium]OWV34199.1 hypothetical protein B5C34_12525 [Pacificimonas flava]
MNRFEQSGLAIVMAMRSWVAAREAGLPPVAVIADRLASMDLSPEIPVVLDSYFGLIEARLGRPLEPECCCSTDLSPDERAALSLLRHAAGQSPSPVTTSAAVPHGLPAALHWAARSLNALFDWEWPETTPISRDTDQHCPFDTGVRSNSLNVQAGGHGR